MIVGGGIAGLTCAVALRRVGHRVLVLEQDPGVKEDKVRPQPLMEMSNVDHTASSCRAASDYPQI